MSIIEINFQICKTVSTNGNYQIVVANGLLLPLIMNICRITELSDTLASLTIEGQNYYLCNYGELKHNTNNFYQNRARQY